MKSTPPERQDVTAISQPAGGGFIAWLQDPLGSVIAATVAVIASFGLVISGSWFIHIALN